MVADNRRGSINHGLGDVGVEIEREDNRNVGSEDLAREPEHVAFDVVCAFRRLRAVHREQQPFRFSDGRKVGGELVGQPLEIRAQQPVRGDRPGRADRSHLLFGLRQNFDEAAHLGHLAAMPVESRGSEDGSEILVPRHHGRECICFLQDGGDCNWHQSI